MGCKKTLGWVVDPVGSMLNAAGVRVPFAPANLINPPTRPSAPAAKPPPTPTITMPSAPSVSMPAPPMLTPPPTGPSVPPAVRTGKEPPGAGAGADVTRGPLKRPGSRPSLLA